MNLFIICDTLVQSGLYFFQCNEILADQGFELETFCIDFLVEVGRVSRRSVRACWPGFLYAGAILISKAWKCLEMEAFLEKEQK